VNGTLDILSAVGAHKEGAGGDGDEVGAGNHFRRVRQRTHICQRRADVARVSW
jgi:hypothetical protein